MSKRSHFGIPAAAVACFLAGGMFSAVADDGFDKLITNQKFKEALEYADESIPMASRTDAIWVKLGTANEGTGLPEKALACYMVAWRLNPANYDAYYGSARIYNSLNQAENGLDMAKKALDIKFTGEASWEFARSCIKLNRTTEAKKALEKVVETDAENVVANRELGNIYFADKQYDKALPLLKKSIAKESNAEISYKIGKACLELDQIDDAVVNLKEAFSKNSGLVDAGLDLARAYFSQGNFGSAAGQYDKVLSKANLTTQDFYQRAFAKEKDNQRDVIDAYQVAISKFGTATSKEALRSREFVARAALTAKRYSDALTQIVFLAKVDSLAKNIIDIYFLMADANIGLNNPKDAISSLEKAIKVNKTNVEAYARLGALYEKNSQSDKAREIFEKLLTFGSSDPHVYVVLGQFNLKAKSFSKALDMFEKSNALAISEDALAGIAICAAELGQWEKAKLAGEAVLEKNGSLWACRRIVAQIYIKEAKYDKAREQLEKLIGQYPTDLELLRMLARAYDALDRKDKLAEIDKKIIALDTKEFDSRFRLAQYSLAKDDFKTAFEVYKQLADITPKNADVFKKLYELSLKNNSRKNAIVYLGKYLELNPKDASASRDLGDMLYEEKNFDGALSAYRAAIAIDPAIKGFFKRYAEIVIGQGKQDEVIKVSLASIKSGEADVGTYTTLGMIYFKTAEYIKSIDMYQKALKLDPQNGDALTSLAACQAKSGDINSAIISYEQAVMMNSGAVKEYKELGDLYLKQNKKDQAMKAYKKYLEKTPGDYDLAKAFGLYAFERKLPEDAVKYLGIAHVGFPKDFIVSLRFGEANFYSGKLDECISIFEELRTQKASDDNLKIMFLLLGQAYEKQNKLEKAAERYAQYSRLDNVNDPEIAYKAGVLTEKTNPGSSTKIYEANTTKYPRDYRNFLRLGLLYAANKETMAKAAPMLKQCTKLADTISQAWVEMAQVYRKMNNESEEFAAWKQVIKLNPQHADANKRLGMIMMTKGNPTEAMIYLELANAFSPNDPDIMSHLSNGYIKSNRAKEAVDLLVKLKVVRPNDVEIRMQLFQIYRQAGQSGKALEEIKSLVTLKKEPKYLSSYAEALVSEGKFSEAEGVIEDIKATIQNESELVTPLMLQAQIQRGKKKFEDAIETYKEITNTNANFVPAIFERAEVYMLMSKPMWAETFYKRALTVDPKFALGELGLAKLAKTRNNKDEYMLHLKKAVQLDGNNAAIKEEWNNSQKK